MTTSMERPLLLVGCGKMGGALLSGWLESGIAAAGVEVIEPMGAAAFEGKPGVTIHGAIDGLAGDLHPEVVVFAVKPQQMDEAAPPFSKFVSPSTVFLSIAAGTTIAYFEDRLGAEAAIVRAMPNTPAAIGQGITVVTSNATTNDAQRALCRALMAATGEAVVVDDEGLMDAVTALSGSGPAYVFLLIECMAEAGVQAGLPRDLAERLALVTVAGSGQLALTSADPPSQLRENVTSPGGTTYEALQVLMADDGLQKIMTEAIAAATRRGRELAG